MRRTALLPWLLLSLLVPAWSAAAPPAGDAAAREIAGLFAALGASSCTFQRNGSWHDAARARAHLQRKYDYLRKRDRALTAERFIALAASRSSVTGQPYRVRCGTAPPVDSAVWFGERLGALRAR